MTKLNELSHELFGAAFKFQLQQYLFEVLSSANYLIPAIIIVISPSTNGTNISFVALLNKNFLMVFENVFFESDLGHAPVAEMPEQNERF